ncbi:MAG: 1,4-dihydroxy-6-naphthoate synthase [Deltaproteobacteria bacterium]|nr:1,4-dihydroxy-6-naphthoate synthase [Deltaproteobacteria bacterium]
MKNNKISIAYSPCPNDTFIFYALANNKIDTMGISYEITIADVEQLNSRAMKGQYDVSKLSFAVLARLGNRYRLLNAGAALGNGCGPLIIARPGFKPDSLKNARIAIPGRYTTAALLLTLFLDSKPNAVSMPFDRIMVAVSSGECDAGVIIHEGRFTFQDYGLTEVIDLGKWWEDTFGLPIPLGGIAVRSDIGDKISGRIEETIRNSLLYARQYPDQAADYIKAHARELSDDVIAHHIDLYVNNYSIDMGETGAKAVSLLFEKAEKTSLNGS